MRRLLVVILLAAAPALGQAKKLSDAACRLDGGAGCGGSGSGTVTSVAMSGGTTGFSFSGGPITTSGTFTLSGTLAIANGGTNLTTYTLGDTLYASAANTLAKLAGNTTTTKKFLMQVGDGVNSAAPTWTATPADFPTFNQNTTGNAATATALATPRNINGIAFDGTGNITVAAAGSTLSDTVPVAKGGTGVTTTTAYSPVITGTTATGAWNVSIGPGTAAQVLTSNGPGVAPSWQAAAGGGANTALSNLASVAINAGLATGAGTAASLTATPPAAITTAQAGIAASVTASAAVAGSSVAGAAAGGTVSLVAGNAARLTSGDANGGNIDLTGVGAGVGTGGAGQVLLASGTVTRPALAFAGSPSAATGFYWASNYIGFSVGGAIGFAAGFSSVQLGTGTFYAGSSITSSDTGLSRAAAGVWRTTAAGGTTSSWLQITPGESRVTTQMDASSNTTLAAITGLTSTLIAGRKYRFRATLFVDADATGGIKFSVAGTATATSIVYQVNAIRNDTSVYAITSRQTALGGAGVGTAAATAYYVEIVGTIVCNAAGTLTPMFAQNAASGTSSVLVNSTFNVVDIQ